MRLLLAVVVALAVPTHAQRAALVTSLRSAQGDVAVQTISVSKADPSYATVRWGFKTATSDSLFHQVSGRWKVIWSRESERPADGACAFSPANVVRELYAIKCPSAAALHARIATVTEQAALEASFRSSKLTPYWRDAHRLANPCISRVDSTWAAATATFSSGAKGVIWFRRRSTWAVVRETLFGGGTRPPPRIVLSLASCVGYSAAEYEGS
jgi:hypothetical protein